MKITRLIILVWVMFLSLISFSQTTKMIFSYTNPITRDSAISMLDHFIIKVENKWYAVGSKEYLNETLPVLFK